MTARRSPHGSRTQKWYVTRHTPMTRGRAHIVLSKASRATRRGPMTRLAMAPRFRDAILVALLGRHLHRLVAVPLQRSGRLVCGTDRRSLLLRRPRLADPVRRHPGQGLRGPRRAALLLHRGCGAGPLRPRHGVGAGVFDDDAVGERGDHVPARHARSGSISAGLAACLLHVWLGPRFYNYPKVLVYAVAIPLLWRFADRPSAQLRVWLAVLTVDRVSLPARPRRVRGHGDGRADAVDPRAAHSPSESRHVVIYGLLVARARGAVLRLHPDEWRAGRRTSGRRRRGPSAIVRASRSSGRACSTIPMACRTRRRRARWSRRCGTTAPRGCITREILLPFFALFVLAARATGSGPNGRTRARSWRWWRCSALRSMPDSCAARSKRGWPIRRCRWSILIAWLMVAVPRMLLSDVLAAAVWLPARWPVRAAVALAGAGDCAVVHRAGEGDLYTRLDKASMTDRFGKAFERAGIISNQLHARLGPRPLGRTSRASGSHHAVALHQRLYQRRPIGCWCSPICHRSWPWRAVRSRAATPICGPASSSSKRRSG